MKKTITAFSSNLWLILSFSVFVLFYLLTNIVFKQNFVYLTQTFGYTPESAYNLLQSIGDSGRSAHLLVFLSDIVMVISYSVFLLGANYRTYTKWLKNCHAITIVTFFPLLLSICQIVEIALLAFIISDYGTYHYTAVNIASAFTNAKYILTTISFLLPIIGLCGTIVKKIKTKKG